MRLLAILPLCCACLSPGGLVAAGKTQLAHHELVAALRTFDQASTAARDPGLRLEALTLAAEAAEARGDLDGAKRRLEAAITMDVPGANEPALYRLARLLETTDRPRALNLYYRAASGAERHRARAYPYHEATTRILVLSQTQ